MQKPLLSYLFFALLVANVMVFGYYNFLKPNEGISKAVRIAQSQLKQPIPFTNASNELPAQIGTKK